MSSSLHSVFMYGVCRLSTLVSSVISHPIMSLVRISQLLASTHPPWRWSHLGLPIKHGTLSSPLVCHWKLSSMSKVDILFQCFETPVATFGPHTGQTLYPFVTCLEINLYVGKSFTVHKSMPCSLNVWEFCGDPSKQSIPD